MSKDLRYYYLQQLGIQCWVKRHSSVKKFSLQLLNQQVEQCTKCPLHAARKQAVFARGNMNADLMVIGEAPGYHEDALGLPFVGKAGSLLNRMLASIGIDNNDVYVANVLKCRPPDNRDPQLEEINECIGYLRQQIALVRPKLILAVGRFAAQNLLHSRLSLSQLRNIIHNYEQIPLVVSYHPAYLLRKPTDKKKAYTDLLAVKDILNKYHEA
ncbi:MAG: uracil-DNA glycosylase [Legionella sp.]